MSREPKPTPPVAPLTTRSSQPQARLPVAQPSAARQPSDPAVRKAQQAKRQRDQDSVPGPAARRAKRAKPNPKAAAAVQKLVNKIRERADKAPPDPLAISDEDKPQRNEAGRFATGRQKTGGRQRGTPNKLPKSIKEVIRMLCDGVLLVDGKVIAHEVAEQLMAGLRAGPPHARGYLELLLNYGVGKPVAQTSGNGGGRFEIILPNARNMRDPLLAPGAPVLPMRILGQDPDKALPAASKDPQSGNQGGRRDIAGGRSGAATSPASSTRASKSGPAPQGVLAKAVQAARGVPAAKIPPPADDQDSPEALKAQLMEVIEEREICPMCNGAKVVRTGHFGEVEKCANCEGTGWLQ